MKSSQTHIIKITGALMLFVIFTLAHHYDWALPPSPVPVTTSASSVPMPDAVEEHNSEDDIDHRFTKSFFIIGDLHSTYAYMVFEDLFIPQISTPPPDLLT